MDALLVAAALLVGGALPLVQGTQPVVGISLVALRTVASEATRLVDALSPERTNIRSALLAFVHIGTGSIRLGLVALRAGTVAHAAGYRNALRSTGAGLAAGAAGKDTAVAQELVRRLALAFRRGADLTHDEGISGVTLWTTALVATRQVLAESIQATGRLSSLQGALV